MNTPVARNQFQNNVAWQFRENRLKDVEKYVDRKKSTKT